MGERSETACSSKRSRRKRTSARPLFGPLLFFSSLIGSAHAQIVTDGSVGAAVSVDASSGVAEIPQTLGQTSGANLLQSFSEFSVPETVEARFTGDAALRTIIARVTGGEVSTIEGLVSVVGPTDADFYLINPSGLTLTEGARFDVPAALYLSTASTLHFADGATLPMAAVTPAGALTIASPSRFGFVGGEGAISISGAQDDFAPATAALSISASDIAIRDSQFQSGAISLYAVGDSALRVGGVGLPAGATGQLLIERSNLVTAPFVSGGGAINVAAGSARFDQGSLQSRTSGARDAGDVHFVGDALSLDNLSTFGSITTGAGQAGDVRIDVNTLQISTGSVVRSNTSGAGDAGEIVVNADRVVIDGTPSPLAPDSLETGLLAQANDGSTGRAGAIVINATTLDVSERGRIITRTYGAGNGGAIRILGADQISLTTGAVVSATTRGGGAAGSITISDAGRLLISGGGALAADSTERNGAFGGPGGAISVEADEIEIDGGEIRTITNTDQAAGTINVIAHGALLVLGEGFISSDNDIGATGDAGSISIRAGTLTLNDHARISSQALGDGDAGAVLVIVDGALVMHRDGDLRPKIGSTSFGGGDAGAVTLRAGSILLDGGAITSQNRSDNGLAGAVSIVSAGAITMLNQGEILTSSLSDNDAGQGALTIEAQSLSLDGARTRIASENGSDTGDAGAITLLIGGDVSLSGGADINSDALRGAAGSITLEMPDSAILLLRGGGADPALITTSSDADEGQGGGRIDISAPYAIIMDGAEIRALGEIVGANVRIESLVWIPSADRVNAVRVDGALVFATSFEDVAAGLETPETPFLDASRVLEGRCMAVHAQGDASTLVTRTTGPYGGAMPRTAALPPAACGAR